MFDVRGVWKSFGVVRALEDVSTAFQAGEIHAVLGENGAGKSTLMNILAGFVIPDRGSVLLDGAPIPLGRAAECRKMGIAMIHQHFTLVPAFTVEENLALARSPRLYRGLRVGALSEPSKRHAERLGWEIDTRERTANLPVGVRQRLEIVKTLAGAGGEARVLIFDEPTAVLAPEEVDEVFRALRELRDEGKVVILIAHKLREVMSVADRVTVLRRGKVVARAPVSGVTESQLAEWMVGDLGGGGLGRGPLVPTPGLEVRDLWVRGDRGNDAIRGLSLEARRGEILGIGGVDGNGQIELAEALAGVRRFRGEIHIPGPLLAYIPQDRQLDGLALSMSIEDNLLIEGVRHRDLTVGPFLRRPAIRTWADGLIARFQVKAPSATTTIDELSGGNQQKVVVARALDRLPDLLVAVDPTRGLDLKATGYVHDQIRQAAAQGAAVVLISSDRDELSDVADRVLFLRGGALSGSIV